MNFEFLLDKVLGKDREIIHEVECPVCEHFETYYRNPITKVTLGRACEYCLYVQRIE